MITLYRQPESPLADAVQEALREIVIQYQVVHVATSGAVPRRGEGTVQDLPALVDDGTVVTGAEALERHLDTLRQLMADWDRFQSDACHIDEDGRLCGHASVRNEDGPGMSVNPALQPSASS